MTNSFTRFRERNSLRIKATDKGNAAFITTGHNSTTITCGETSLTAAVVNEQEKDQAYIYTDVDNTLKIGSIWTAKGLH